MEVNDPLQHFEHAEVRLRAPRPWHLERSPSEATLQPFLSPAASSGQCGQVKRHQLEDGRTNHPTLHFRLHSGQRRSCSCGILRFKLGLRNSRSISPSLIDPLMSFKKPGNGWQGLKQWVQMPGGVCCAREPHTPVPLFLNFFSLLFGLGLTIDLIYWTHSLL